MRMLRAPIVQPGGSRRHKNTEEQRNKCLRETDTSIPSISPCPGENVNGPEPFGPDVDQPAGDGVPSLPLIKRVTASKLSP